MELAALNECLAVSHCVKRQLPCQCCHQDHLLQPQHQLQQFPFSVCFLTFHFQCFVSSGLQRRQKGAVFTQHQPGETELPVMTVKVLVSVAHTVCLANMCGHCHINFCSLAQPVGSLENTFCKLLLNFLHSLATLSVECPLVGPMPWSW